MNNSDLTSELMIREDLIKLREAKYAEIEFINEKISKLEREDFIKNTDKYVGKFFEIGLDRFYHVSRYDPYHNKLVGELIKYSSSEISVKNVEIDMEEIGLEEIALKDVKSTLYSLLTWIILEFSA